MEYNDNTMVLISSWGGTEHPNEDHIRWDSLSRTAIVADGVTLFGFDEKIPVADHYPDPSPVAQLAQEWSSFILAEVAAQVEWNAVKAKELASSGNSFIEAFNKRLPWDAVSPRPLGLVAAVAREINGILAGFVLGDSGMLVLRNENIAFASPDNPPSYHALIPKEIDGTSEKRPWAFHNLLNKTCRYVCFNGQSGAEEFVTYFEFPLQDGDIVVIFTDGLSSLFRNICFLSTLSKLPFDRIEEEIQTRSSTEKDDRSFILWNFRG